MDKGKCEFGLSPTPGASKLMSRRPCIAWAKWVHEPRGLVNPLMSSSGSPSPSN